MNKFRKIFAWFKKVSQIQPLSLRGTVAILVSFTCLFYYGKNQSDLVALTIGSSVALCFLVALFSLLGAVRSVFKPFRNFQDLSDPQQEFFSEVSNTALIYLPQIKIPPFFSLSITRIFDEAVDKEKILSIENNLNGTFSTGNIQTVLDNLNFPHRGEYLQKGFLLTFRDSLGLTRISKLVLSPRVFHVNPRLLEIKPLPIMAASAQLGDVEHSTIERTGDLFDIREYQPGDSLKRVLWKVFARSGNVVVRHPEPAIVPEGEVAIFVVARSNHDRVAASTISYLKILEDQNIIFSLSCLGNDKDRIANTADEAKDILIKSAFRSDSDKGDSFARFIQVLESKNFRAKKIILFIPKELSELTSTENDTTLLNNISNVSNNAMLALSLALVHAPKEINYRADASTGSMLENFDQRLHDLPAMFKIDALTKLSFPPKKKPKSSMLNSQIFKSHQIIEVEYSDV